MACVLKLITTLCGIKTEFDHSYVVEYDPTYRLPDGSYDGGILKVSRDPREAMRFPGFLEAYRKFTQAYGWRPDGEPNRPLTMWAMSVEDAPEDGEEAA